MYKLALLSCVFIMACDAGATDAECVGLECRGGGIVSQPQRVTALRGATIDPNDHSGASCGDPGIVKGLVCSPGKQVFVSGATITIKGRTCDGQPFRIETTSDADGEYVVRDVPIGEHTVIVQKGRFETRSSVTVRGGRVTDLSGADSKMCFAPNRTRIAVLDGEWDDLANFVSDLGFEYDLFTPEPDEAADGTIADLLADPDRLFKYDIIFVGCGHASGHLAIEHPEQLAHIRDYVMQGGSLYLSDYAWTLGEVAFPDAVDWVQNDDPKHMGDCNKSPQQIPGDARVAATIADPKLAAWLGEQTLNVAFDEGPQIAAEAVGPGTTAHVVADLKLMNGKTIKSAPLALSYQPGQRAGRVVYTNFHNDAQSTDDILEIMRYLVFTL